jgi:hypothetical protein
MESMKRTFPGLFVLACLAVPLQAQLPIGFGLKGGARLTDFTEAFSNQTSGQTNQNTVQDHVYTIGPYAELHLPIGFSLEADLLYKKSASTYSQIIPLLGNSRQFNFDSFDLPILAKKKFGAKGAFFRPFVEGGLANRYSTGLPGSVTLTTPITSIGTHSGWQEGIVLGGGVELKVLILRISGELRWTRFGNISTSTLPKLNANQAELLIGVGL